MIASTGADIVLTRMPGWQDGRADCNNAGRWDGKRRRYAAGGRYWLCGDGGGRDAAGLPDPRTWRNLFVGADVASGRAK